MKTSELKSNALDWAVAKCEDISYPTHWILVQGDGWEEKYQPSINWAQGGSIIERERIDVFSISNGTGWCAMSDVRVFNGYGSTPLVAAMRCYVANKLGDEIEIPKELI